MKCEINIFFVVIWLLLLSVPTVLHSDDSPFQSKEIQAYDSADQATSSSLELLRITPEGNDVPVGRQIVFQFDRAVVPIGRMERDADEIPIEISPEVKCQWRWINTSALACQLDEADELRPATHYRISISPGIKTDDGIGMPHGHKHHFITTRPKVSHSHFLEWRAPGWPRVQLTFNQPVTKESVQRSMQFLPGSGYRGEFGMQVTPAEDDREPIFWAPFPGEPYGLLNPEYRSETIDDREMRVRGKEARRVWVIEPEKELPLDSQITLLVAPGLVSAQGPEKGIESRTIVSFRTYPEFRFLGIRCVSPETESSVLIKPQYKSIDEIPADLTHCLPYSISLEFTAPVINEEVAEHVTFTPDLAGGRTDYDPWANQHGYSRLRYPHRSGALYHVALPEMLKAFQGYGIKSDATGIKDEFGRSLDEPIDMAFMTSHRLPRMVLNHRKAVLEKNIDTDVPVYVTNLDKLKAPHQVVTSNTYQDVSDYELDLEEAEDISYAAPLGLRKMLNGKSGVVIGRLDSEPQVRNYRPEHYEFFAQITPFQVHIKLGHFNSIVWITDLATGEAVEGADLSVYVDNYYLGSLIAQTGKNDADSGLEPGDSETKDKKSSFSQYIDRLFDEKVEESSKKWVSENKSALAVAKSDDKGIAWLPGIETLSPDLSLLHRAWYEESQRLFVRVQKQDDIALIPLDHNFSTRSGALWPSNRMKNGHLHAWGTTAQGVYKVGDTIQYKFYVRNQSNRHWVEPPKAAYALKVIDPKGEAVLEIDDLALSEFGSYSGEFKVSEQAAVGWYRFELKVFAEKTQTLQPMRVLVSDFTPSPFKTTVDLNGRQFEPDDRIEVNASAKLHAGGSYTNAKTRVTARLIQQRFTSNHTIAGRFRFEGYSSQRNEYTLYQNSSTGNDQGEVNDAFTLNDQKIYYGKIAVEAAVSDDRGKYVAAQTTAKYYGRDRYVGLRNTEWVYDEDKKSEIEYIVVDRNGDPVAGTPVEVNIEREEVKAARVKGAGNAYLTQYTNEWIGAGGCSGVSTTDAVVCSFTPEHPGSYRFTAKIKDSKQREHVSQIDAWVIGKGQVYWQEPDDYSLQIVPESDSYKVGDTARFLVKNPFPGATALITVERYGILHHWTQTLENSTEILEVPIEADYLSGFYLSVLVNSPRVEPPPEDPVDEGEPEQSVGHVDLGKPTFRLGYVKIDVKDDYKAIDIKIATDLDVYKPRQTVKARINATPRSGAREEPVELAVVVIDEAVLDLNASGRDYYDPYNGFNKLDALDVNNYSLLTRLVGRQKFEKKGANPGGGGGEAGPSLRNLFKYVAYWNPSIKPDAQGRAEIEFKLPDNLTGWRIFAMAVTPKDRMGLGDYNIKVNLPTELRPVMPNQLTEGDSFVAGFSVMNRTEQARTVTVQINAVGPLDVTTSPDSTSAELELQPYKRQTVWLPLKTKGFGEIGFLASAKDDLDGDAIEHHVPVNKRRSMLTAANYGTTTKSEISDKLAFPQGIFPDIGGVSIVTAPSVIGNVDGAFEYIRDYPYYCWEQRLTKAVMASHYNNLRSYLPDDLTWADSETLPQRMLDQAAAFQAPNGGMTYWIPDNSYVSPYLSAYTALAFNWLRKSGYQVPDRVEQKLHDYLDDMLRRDVMPTFFSSGMASSVRAVALAAMAEHGKLRLNDLQRYAPHLSEMDLFGKAHFLQAASFVDGAQETLVEAAKVILSHASQSGGKFQFNEVWDDSYSYILATPLRSNCTILSALMHITTNEEMLKLVGDVPFKQVRAITQSRGNRSHWENTQENVFCMNALTDYARVYENEKPDMRVQAFIGDKAVGETHFGDLRDKAVTFVDPITKASPGLKTVAKLTKDGPGRLYYATRMQYAPTEDNAERINAGMDIRREYAVERDGKWQLLNSPMQIKRGELVRVDIFVSLPTLRHFVVVDDPVPGGLEPVNRDLATASVVDADKGNFKASEQSYWFTYGDWSYYGVYGYSFYHKELRHNAARFYADYVPAGNYHLSYTAQAIATGEFSVMPVHSEEMYDPDVFGKGLPATLRVGD